ncbi:hypothetical protein LCGC14_2409720 [marine sediment metagenome]|uniref:Uncharacterized protein n=1 Tax=marine sediment metagenome TaxID=412755 RepID=A0A0F9BSQ8_9ZZZZ
MRVGIIRPDSSLHDSELATDFHFVLAQQCLASEAYSTYYREAAERGEFVLLDNGAAELGRSVSAEDLLKACELINPSVVVAPDVLFDSDATIFRTMQFLGRVGGRYKVMAVPQGRNDEDYLETFHLFNQQSSIAWLGLTKYATPAFGSRVALLKIIEPIVDKPCHLLGLWYDALELLEEKQFSFAKSTDSSRPVKLALQGLHMLEHKRYTKDPALQFFEHVLTEEERALAISNAHCFISLAGGL